MNSDLLLKDTFSSFDIDKCVDNFVFTLSSNTKKTVLSSDIKKTVLNVLLSLSPVFIGSSNSCIDLGTISRKQIKDSMNLKDRRSMFGITLVRDLDSYDHGFMIQSFKDQLSVLSCEDDTSQKQPRSVQMFIIISNLCLYLKQSGKFITSQDYDDMKDIIGSKGANFSISFLDPEISPYINIIREPVVYQKKRKRGFNCIIKKKEYSFYVKKFNNFYTKNLGNTNSHKKNPENILALSQLTDFFHQDLSGKNISPIYGENITDNNTSFEDMSLSWEKIIKNESQKFKGYYSIGGKIHFPESIDTSRIDEFKQKFGFSSTAFKLIHANTSLLLPPTCSPHILLFYILALEKSGLITGSPDLQLAIPGRLPNWSAAMLGSVMLLSSDTHVEYSQDAFKTTHDELTGARIMAYDDGELEKRFTYNSPKLVGRTDMLGISDLNSVYTYHFLGSILSQAFYGGKYADIGKQFMKEYQQLLETHNLQWILHEQWIYDEKQDTLAGAESHYSLIKTLTDIQKQNWEQYLTTQSENGLIVFNIKKLLNKYQKKLNYVI